MFETFLAAALTYTALEITYWYFRWWGHLSKEPLPIVKSLLFAVFNAHLVMLISYGYHLYSGQPLFNDPAWMTFIWFGSIFHLLPIWKQKLNRRATVEAYFLRVIAFASLAALIGSYV